MRLHILVVVEDSDGDFDREVLRHVRSNDLLSTVPVVVLSASANPRDLQFWHASGANARHVKPVAHATHLKVQQDIFGYWLGSALLPD